MFQILCILQNRVEIIMFRDEGNYLSSLLICVRKPKDVVYRLVIDADIFIKFILFISLITFLGKFDMRVRSW